MMTSETDFTELITDQLQPLLAKSQLSCSISSEEVGGRQILLNKISSQITSKEMTEDRAILYFNYHSDIAHLLLDFSIKEQQCCNFFVFDIILKQKDNVIEFHISSDDLNQDDLAKIVSMIVTI